jgi:pimeloyl-ACP methyl ester carboxylesterase
VINGEGSRGKLGGFPSPLWVPTRGVVARPSRCTAERSLHRNALLVFPKNRSPRSIFVTAPDGLRLHVREWGSHASRAMPVVCLPGFARTGRDFETLATALARDSNTPRRVLALDSRGRGKSEYDRNPANYNLPTELADVLAVLTALEIGRAVFVGTSRGGILVMLLGAARPGAIAGCVLNDIGPVIELEGLARIKGYVGKLPRPGSYQEAAEVLRKLFVSQFPKLTGDDWLAFARRTFKEAGGHIVPDYDVRLGLMLEEIDLEQPLPALWKEFDSLARVPMMLLHGSNSDILSAATVAEMQARRSGLKHVTVADQGHAPLLADADSIGRIAAFIANCDP